MKKNHISAICLTIAMLFVLQSLSAVPAYPHPVAYLLPDGTEITIQLQGDERVNWRVSEDGYTLLFNADGFLEYAVLDASGDLQLSGMRARNLQERASEETSFLAKIPKALRYSSAQVEAMSEVRKFVQQSAFRQAPRKIEGTIRIPIILVQFQDKKFIKTKADFQMLFDQLDYTANGVTGSLRDYYLANSYGKMDLRVDVFGPYTLPKNIAAYDQDCNMSSSGNPREMFRLAIDSAYHKDAVDFSDYVMDGGDTVDAVHLIYAGYGAEAGAPVCQSMWAHAWWLVTPVEYDGTVLHKYSCSPELRGNSGSGITHIGVVAHELGHALCGLPDFYDADYASNGTSVHLGAWDLMASGSWNDNGRTPAYFSAYGRDFCGWTSAVTLSEPTDVDLPNPALEGAIYRINTNTANEYFLVENRQKIGWDAYIPASGMLIYHVNKNHSGWNNNTVNNDLENRGYYVKQAGCTNTHGCQCVNNGNPVPACPTNPWPQDENTEFTDYSTPHSKSWAGENTNKPITEITHNTSQRTVSFKFMGGNPPEHYDAALTEIIAPTIVQEEGTQEIKVKLENNGMLLTSATILWYVDGAAQTTVRWTGDLAFEKSEIVMLGTINLSSAHVVSAVVTVNKDTMPENNIISKVIKVSESFFAEDFEEKVRHSVLDVAGSDPQTPRKESERRNNGIADQVRNDDRASEVTSWNFANENQTNQWHIGTATAQSGEKSAYISNNGDANQYTILNGISTSHLYRDLTFPVSTDSFDLYFDFKGMGEQGSSATAYRDYMEVRMVETNVTPTAGTALTEGISLGRYNMQEDWQTIYTVLPPSYSGTTQRLVFSWINDRTSGTQTPAAMDNIIVALRPELPAFYDIALSQNDTLVLDTTFNYEAYPAFPIIVANTGTQATGTLSIALSGTDAGSFTLSETAISNLVTNDYHRFTVAPRTALAVGTYTAKIAVNGENNLSESFDLKFTVKPNISAIFDRKPNDVLAIYPNPVTDGELTIENGAWKSGDRVEIFDLTGRRVYVGTPITDHRSSLTLNIAHLPKGTYVVKIGAVSAKILKKSVK